MIGVDWYHGCMSSMIRSSRTICLPAMALLVFVTGCGPRMVGRGTESSGGLPPIVTAVKPERKTLVRTVELPGRTEAFEATPVYAKVTGYVQKISVDIGDAIRGPRDGDDGTVLCELEVPELREELA